MASLIARAALFGNPVRTQARVSPDGRYISFLAPQNGVLNVWLAPFANLQAAKRITDDKGRGVRERYWAFTAAHVLYVQDAGEDENWRVLSVDVESGAEIDLTPRAGVQAQSVGLSALRPTCSPVASTWLNPQNSSRCWSRFRRTGRRSSRTWRAEWAIRAQKAGERFSMRARRLRMLRASSGRSSIVQGANDPRVKQAEADQIVAAMTEKSLPVTYALCADEGHGFARPQNRVSFYAIAEASLSKYLGGRCEPIGRDFEDSSVIVSAGAQFVPGIAAALAARRSSGAR